MYTRDKMKLILIVLFQIFLPVLELESVSNDRTINLMICQKQSSKCCRCSGICYNNNGDYGGGDIDGDNGDGDDGDNGDGGDDNGDGDDDGDDGDDGDDDGGDGDGGDGDDGDNGDGGDDNGDVDDGDGDLDYNNNYECEETDPIKGINIACIRISTEITSLNFSLINILTECIGSKTTDAHRNLFPPTSKNHQTPETIESLPCTEMSTSNKLLHNCSATNAFITQAEALGAIIGLLAVILILAVLLMLAITGWMRTYLALKKKGSMNINKTNNSEMETRYHNEMSNTQQQSNEDQFQRDLNDERAHFYDVIPPTNATPAVANNTATTNTEEASTKQHTYMATDRQQQIWAKNDPPPGHPPPLGDRDAVEGSSYEQGQSQTTTTTLGDGNPDDSTNVHIYHALEEPQSTTKKEIEMKDHNPPAAYEVPVANTAVKQS